MGVKFLNNFQKMHNNRAMDILSFDDLGLPKFKRHIFWGNQISHPATECPYPQEKHVALRSGYKTEKKLLPYYIVVLFSSGGQITVTCNFDSSEFCHLKNTFPIKKPHFSQFQIITILLLLC